MNANALILVALRRDHHIGLVQHKHRDLLHVQHLELQRPIENLARRADNNVIGDGLIARHLLAAHRKAQLDLRTILGHFGGHLARLDGQLEGGRQTQHLRMVLGRIDAAEHGQHKGGRFAGARLTLGDHVLRRIGEQGGQGGLLDLGGFVEADGVHALEEFRFAVREKTY